MRGILKDFAVRRLPADPQHQAEFGAQAEPAMPYGMDDIIHFIDHL